MQISGIWQSNLSNHMPKKYMRQSFIALGLDRKKRRNYAPGFVVLTAFLALFSTHFILNQTGLSVAFASFYAAGERPVDPSSIQKIYNRIEQKPDALLQLDGKEVRSVLASPKLVYGDLPVTIWQYRGDACTLDVFFKTDSRDDVDGARVIRYETRNRQTAAVPMDDASCVRRILDDGTSALSLAAQRDL